MSAIAGRSSFRASCAATSRASRSTPRSRSKVTTALDSMYLCRTIPRTAIASERLSIDPNDRVVYRLRRAWHDGNRAILFEPLAFLGRWRRSSRHPT